MKRKPRALVPGNTVAVVAPSGIVNKDNLDRGIAALESMGLKVKVFGSVFKQHGYMAGEDRDRAKDFTEAWTDPGCQAVLAARGGFGAARMLRHLDFEALRPHKKVFMGYSDLTALHLALWKKLRVVTFHGPVVEAREGEGLLEPYNFAEVRTAMMEGRPAGDLALPDGARLTCITAGSAEGDLVGGNLSLVAASVGTWYEVDTKGKILFLEDLNEAPYRIDRMLGQMEAAGKLADAAGFLIGEFTDCESSEPSRSFASGEVLRQYLGDKGKPCVAGIPAGHEHFNVALPLGVKVAVDGDRARVAFTERALV